jgi:hypothetical protein
LKIKSALHIPFKTNKMPPKAKAFLKKKQARAAESAKVRRAVVEQAREELMVPAVSAMDTGKLETTFHRADDFPSAIGNERLIPIEIDRDRVGFVELNYIRVEVRNSNSSGGANITPPKYAWDMFKDGAIRANGKADVLMKLSKQALKYPFCFVADEQMRRWRNAMESGASEVIAPQASRVYWLPILCDPFVQNKIYLAGLTSDLFYELKFDSTVWSAAPELVSLAIVSVSRRYSSVSHKAMIDSMAKGSIQHHFTAFENDEYPDTLTSSSTQDFKVSSYSGVANAVFVQAAPQDTPSDDMVNAVDSYDVKNSKDSLISNTRIDANMSALILGASVQNLLAESDANTFTLISFSDDLAADWGAKEDHGHHVFDRKDKFNITWASNLQASSKLTITYMKPDGMVCDAGHLSPLK